MSDFFSISLPKWPSFIVVGKPVTKDQAKEIIIRTDSLYFSTNDTDFAMRCSSYMLGRKYNSDCRDAMDLFDNIKQYSKAKDELIRSVNQLELDYLENKRIVSCWIGGAHGWCDWNGRIGCNNYNVGKWPSVEEIYREWIIIAEAFPFLDLKSQLLSGEGCEDDLKPLIQFDIKDGTVTMSEVEEMLDYPTELPITDFFNRSERGCTFDQFKDAIDFVKSKYNMEK